MMINEDYRRILDFFFSGTEVSPELKSRFREWLSVHGEEPQTRMLLEEYWNSESSVPGEFDLNAGLEKLMSAVSAKDKAPSAPKPFSLRKMTKWFAVAAAAAILFISGYSVSEISTRNQKETVLMASSENVSSYVLPDGTKIWLNKDSWLSYDESFGRKDRRVALTGEAYFEVTRNEACPFIVKMKDDLQVKVLGTTFNVCTYPEDELSEVILRSGSVQVSDEQSHELVILKPDQKFSRTGGITEVSQVNAKNCCRWYERTLTFDNVMFKDVLENLSHKYQQKITCDTETRLSDKRISLTVRDESLTDILEILSSMMPVRWSVQGEEVLIENKHKKH